MAKKKVKPFEFGDKVTAADGRIGVIGGSKIGDEDCKFVLFANGVSWDYVKKLTLKHGWKKNV